MGFLRKLVGGGAKAPDWASFLTGEEYAAFQAALEADLRARGWSYTQRDDGLFVDMGDPEPRVYGLTNLAQLCARVERADWPAAIRDHFDHMDKLFAEVDADVPWDAARALLKPRVFPTGDAERYEAVSYPLTPELSVVLALDYPDSVKTLHRDHVDAWPAADELYAIALENLRADPAPAPETVTGPNGVAFDVYEGDSYFTASHLLRLAELRGDPRLTHALVAVPNRHLMLVHEIRDLTVAPTLGAMVNGAASAYESGPGSITPDVLWWHAGALTRIPAWIDKKGVNIAPPDAFTELLNTLAAPAD